MTTDEWEKPEADAAEQAASVDDTEESETRPRPDTEANEADSLEQTRELPEDDEYRDA